MYKLCFYTCEERELIHPGCGKYKISDSLLIVQRQCGLVKHYVEAGHQAKINSKIGRENGQIRNYR